MERIRKVIFYKRYFLDFASELSPKILAKISRVIDLIEIIERVPEKYLKHIAGTNGLFEIRIAAGTNIFRIFCFFDKGKLVVLMNDFQKKTMKTPANGIERALKIKKEYEDSK
ncbi:type II toxin-antitoxin system RelE/ParE family toxin [Mucilaginibacter sp. JRF]|uniref:type II toxin-antitoxin system RelE/ParE family toxin n=1 Tax=Mucilaginibacter sp. JRF TaxID=2780088 RepID=UPI0018800D64|nr:type II toxin-antitoxin system RelE/ParE family toxin [Mucilaginibacter sp. JRF]MBE9585172.1 type II toxin-antitoxin system RelE/ParE family toxin [Mucilaginibacter sp. JRF]